MHGVWEVHGGMVALPNTAINQPHWKKVNETRNRSVAPASCAFEIFSSLEDERRVPSCATTPPSPPRRQRRSRLPRRTPMRMSDGSSAMNSSTIDALTKLARFEGDERAPRGVFSSSAISR